MRKWIMAAAALAALAAPARAGSTVNPAIPAQGSIMQSAPIRTNFQAAANDINNILSMFGGPSAPLSPLVGQFWRDTASSPWPITIWDGTVWVQIGTLNPTAHTFSFAVPALPSFVSFVSASQATASFGGL